MTHRGGIESNSDEISEGREQNRNQHSRLTWEWNEKIDKKLRESQEFDQESGCKFMEDEKKNGNGVVLEMNDDNQDVVMPKLQNWRRRDKGDHVVQEKKTML